MVLGSIKDIEEGNQIVPVIFQRLCNRLTHCLECGKMDDGINAELRKEPVHRIIVAAVNLLERDVILSRYLLDPFKACEVAI